MSQLIVHATTVALNGKAALITGGSGAGKSSLGLELMAYGCDLVADDRTMVFTNENGLIASSPAQIFGHGNRAFT